MPGTDPNQDQHLLRGPKGTLSRVTHGGFTPRIYQPLAEQLIEALLEVRPDLDDPSYVFAVAEWAETEVRVGLFRERLAKVGPLDGKGKPREFLLRWEHSLANRAAAARKILGLDPRSAAELRKTRNDAVVSGWDAEAAFDKALALDEARRSRAAIDAESNELADAGAELVAARRHDAEPPRAIKAGETIPEEEG